MARVFYLGAPSHPALSPAAPVSELMRATGNNTGNLLIGHALKRQLKMETTGTGLRADPKHVAENYDYIVIGAANMLYRNSDFSEYADFVESVELPCVIIGLGAQAPDYDCRVEIPQGTERLMKIISERSTSLGVRGDFSAATLARLGIKNVRVIGCPSMYWNCQPELRLKPRAATDRLVVALNGSANVVDHSVDAAAAKKVEAALSRLSFDHGYPYILQNERSLMEIGMGETTQNQAFLPKLMTMYGLDDVSPETFVRFVQRNMKTYGAVDVWHAAMKEFDFVLGSRFHGCLIGLLAGAPCCIFTHDARTREMCELLRLPHVDIRNAGDLNVRSLYESLDLDALCSAYRRRYRNYVEFLDENHIEHVLTSKP